MRNINRFTLQKLGLIIFALHFSCKKDDATREPVITEKSVISQPSSNGEIIKHNYYTLSYSEPNEQAEWVYYKLTDEMLLGNELRTDDFRVDSLVSTGSADLSDYAGSGYDRGHLCPAGDMIISKTSMSESFYLSNMSPQNASFNRGIWSTLESTVRNIAKTEKEVYVVTGPVFRNNIGVIGNNKVTVPGYYFKVIYAPGNEKMIGFVLPNAKGMKEIKDYAVTVDSVEKLANIDMFPMLATSLESKLEANIDINNWELIPLSLTDTIQ